MQARLDIILHESGLCESRSKARDLIISGNVTVNDKVITKPSFAVSDNDKLHITEALKYVSRAGYKLEAAVKAFGLDFSGKTCLDAGAATGGFTDLMLQNGAKKIYAVDVGENQLHQSLREDKRVVVMEKQDARTLILPERVDFITADLSFISLRQIIPVFKALLKAGGEAAALIKPQFEAGKARFKNGVIKDERLIKTIVWDIETFIKAQGYEVVGTVPVTTLQNKNREFIIYFKEIEA